MPYPELSENETCEAFPEPLTEAFHYPVAVF